MCGVLASGPARGAITRLVLPFANGEHVYLEELRHTLGEATSLHFVARELLDAHWLPRIYNPNGRNCRLRTIGAHWQDGHERRPLVVPSVRLVLPSHLYERFALASPAAEGTPGQRPPAEHRVSTSAIRGEAFGERGRSGRARVAHGDPSARLGACVAKAACLAQVVLSESSV